MAGKRLDRIEYHIFKMCGKVAEKLVAAVVAADHGFSVLPLGTRGPF